MNRPHHNTVQSIERDLRDHGRELTDPEYNDLYAKSCWAGHKPEYDTGGYVIHLNTPKIHVKIATRRYGLHIATINPHTFTRHRYSPPECLTFTVPPITPFTPDDHLAFWQAQLDPPSVFPMQHINAESPAFMGHALRTRPAYPDVPAFYNRLIRNMITGEALKTAARSTPQQKRHFERLLEALHFMHAENPLTRTEFLEQAQGLLVPFQAHTSHPDVIVRPPEVGVKVRLLLLNHFPHMKEVRHGL